MKNKNEWKNGNRAFSWTDPKPQYISHELCLQSEDFNLCPHCQKRGTITWVYYSKQDARKLYKFLKEIFEGAHEDKS